MTDKIKLPLRYRIWVALRTPALWRSMGGVLLVASALLSAWAAQEVRDNTKKDIARAEADREADAVRSCEDRAAGREDAKRGILGVADEASVILGADTETRELINKRGSSRLDAEFPDLVCEGPPSSTTTLPPTTIGVFLTCDEARTAGAAPIAVTDERWSPALRDGDGDGIACE